MKMIMGVALALGLALVVAGDGSAQNKGKVKAKQIVIIEGTKPATVKEVDIVRIVATGIAGAEIKGKVTSGPGKVQSVGYLRTLKDGHMMIGTTTKEYNIVPTGKGTIKFEVTVKQPTSDEPKVSEYTVKVE